MDKDWKTIRRLFSESSGIPERIIDYRESYQILTLYIHGKGLQTIRNALNINIESLQEVLLDCLGEILHVSDLNYSPYNANSNEYLDMCEKYDTIMEEVESYE